ncbi:MAG: hypothetical protein WA700_01710 [Acidobacteriaceae bacterium]
MTVCETCDELMDRRTFDAPEDYRTFIRLLIEKIREGKLVLMRGDCALEDMLGTSWPGNADSFSHDLRCTGCNRVFHLYANVWNGRNWWEPVRW